MNLTELNQRIPDWGFDIRPENRPGVPMETEPRPMEGVHWREPFQQQGEALPIRRAGLERITPVYGTSLPPRGLSGMLRRFAYSIPEHRARHWMVLLLADRVDPLEYALGKSARWLPLVAAAGGAWLVRRAVGAKKGRGPFVTRRRRPGIYQPPGWAGFGSHPSRRRPGARGAGYPSIR